ncbi:MAG TPA: ABC transporter substrate-binding protein [Patescibacteria group bacterium]|nr:ABC transporter substrate-binding protein [Patescibacteria group bacterium]
MGAFLPGKQKKITLLAVLLLLLTGLSGCGGNRPAPAPEASGGIRVTDDQGKTVVLKAPARRIISLYSAHTENLFSLGLDQEVIGVSTTETYPPAALGKPAFDYRADPERVLAAQPDLVLIRPFIRQSHPDFVKTLENAKIPVVALYPEKFAEFDEYIQKLAILTGREPQAQAQLTAFHQRLDAIAARTAQAPVKKRVYFETTATEYRTVTADSLPALLLQQAGGINVAADATPLKGGSSIAAYGTERLLLKGADIDVYLAQKGPMNPGITPVAVKARPGFDKIKAVREGQVFLIDEKLVSTPTFRLADGAEELAKLLYPELVK